MHRCQWCHVTTGMDLFEENGKIVEIIAGVCGDIGTSYGTYTYNTPVIFGGTYLLGTIATLHCDDRYLLHDGPSVICVIWKNGKWFWVPTDVDYGSCRGEDYYSLVVF